jgi:hypothetical protein
MKKIYKSRMARRNLRNITERSELLKRVSEKGRIFSVQFIKKDGSQRKMTCRQGVKKHLRGGINTTRHIKKYLTVFSINDKGYRTVNLETIKQVKGAGQVFNF